MVIGYFINNYIYADLHQQFVVPFSSRTKDKSHVLEKIVHKVEQD